MAKNTSVSLGDYFDAFINRKISEGRYKNVSEVIRAGLRLLEEEENKMIFISNALKNKVKLENLEAVDPKNHLEFLPSNDPLTNHKNKITIE